MRYPLLPAELKHRIYRVRLEHVVAGVKCHNVFWVLDHRDPSASGRQEAVVAAFGQWWTGPFLNSAVGPSFYTSAQAQLQLIDLQFLRAPEEDAFDIAALVLAQFG